MKDKLCCVDPVDLLYVTLTDHRRTVSLTKKERLTFVAYHFYPEHGGNSPRWQLPTK